MIKVFTSNKYLYRKCLSIPVVKHLVSFNFKKLYSINDANLFVKIIHDIRMGNGTYKTTGVNRLEEVDRKLFSILDTTKLYKIHDVAVSDGITSKALFESLKKLNVNFKLEISDKYAELFFKEERFVTRYYDVDGNFLFANLLGIWANRYLPRRFFFSYLIGYLFRLKKVKNSRLPSVLLINPDTRGLMDSKNILFKTYDIFQCDKPTNQYDIIRCMNILNPNYFSESQIVCAISNFISTMAPNGLLIVGRTDPGTGLNNVTFYRKENKGLTEMFMLNKGSEIHEIIKNNFSA